MEFRDDGVILSVRPHGENHAVVDVLTDTHGRWSGFVYGGQSRKMAPVLQLGNGVRASWTGRVEDSLGHFTLELVRARAGELLHDRLALTGLSAAMAMAREGLPEREAHPKIARALAIVMDSLNDPLLWPALFARWELGLLAEMGFGLTLDRCAATGSTERLIYVSPRSACAVCAEAGAPYRSKLLPLPAFLRDQAAEASPQDMIDGLRLTAYFIETRLLHPVGKSLPDVRVRAAELAAAYALAPPRENAF